MANELFELCKEVYKRTGWKSEEGHVWTSIDGINGRPVISDKPFLFAGFVQRSLYTTDYLLDKLPVNTTLQHQDNKWVAQVMGETSVFSSDTPLKALLKLTIALDEAGELTDLVRPKGESDG